MSKTTGPSIAQQLSRPLARPLRVSEGQEQGGRVWDFLWPFSIRARADHAPRRGEVSPRGREEAPESFPYFLIHIYIYFLEKKIIIALLRHNPHTTQFAHLKGAARWFSAYSQSRATIPPSNFRTFLSSPKEASCP